jgi:hypothetical protein
MRSAAREDGNRANARNITLTSTWQRLYAGAQAHQTTALFFARGGEQFC